MHFLRHLSIKQKLVVSTMLTTCVALLLAGVAFAAYDLMTFRRAMRHDLLTLARIIGTNSTAALVFEDRQAAVETLAALHARQHIVSAALYTPQGEVFAQYHRAGALQDVVPPAPQPDSHRFEAGHLVLFQQILRDGEPVGTIYVKSDLQEMYARQESYAGIGALVLLASASVSFLLAAQLQRVISEPILHLAQTAQVVSNRKDYAVRAVKYHQDEVGLLIDSFNEMLTQIQERTEQLDQANAEITALNAQLQAENLRMGAELEVSRKLQHMLLPTAEELHQIADLDIACYMEPAAEVGGDYYDILQHNGQIKIGIGDVTGHGLESGVLMVMTQAIVRALMANGETDPVRFLTALNHALYGNVQRMGTDKNLTLALLDYTAGDIRLSGQHETMLVVRCDGTVEVVDTIDLGFPVALVDEIADFIQHTTVRLQPGDGVVLYTDGITEAEGLAGQQYGLGRLCTVVSQHWAAPAEVIKERVVRDVHQHIGGQRMYDDITLVVVKRR